MRVALSPQTARLLLSAGVLILLFLPLVGLSNYFLHLIILAFLYAVLASNWDLTLGYAGIFNWAHTTIFALGAYTAGILSARFGVSPWLCVVAAMVVAVIASIIVCLPVLRVKGIYVVLVTFAFGQICLHAIRSMSDLTGGTQGLVRIPGFTIGDYSFMQDGKVGYYYVALLLLIASTVYLRRLVRSNFGLSILALRDNEDYAVSRGVPVARQRLLVFAASAVFTGGAGAVFAFYLGVVSPELFGFSYVATLLSMVLLGGVSSIYGPIVGAFVLTFVSEFMVDLGPWRFLIISAVIVIVMRFYPEGSLAALKHLFPVRAADERRGEVGTQRSSPV
jgi:branched-chain amino acid transport system permease protein